MGFISKISLLFTADNIPGDKSSTGWSISSVLALKHPAVTLNAITSISENFGTVPRFT